MRFFASGFFHGSSPSKPLKKTLGSFQFFSKILSEIFGSHGEPPVSTTLAANLPPMSTIPTANGKLPPASMTPVVNLPYVNSTSHSCSN
jgi:hypothetical protein